MQKRSLVGLAVLAVVAVLSVSAPALARSHRRPHAASVDYINPFADPGWQPSRTDMGVDWVPVKPEPVLAIGNAVILGSDTHSGWPGGRIIWYQLLDGSHQGDIIYVAEHLRHLIAAGTHVRAGDEIALAIPGYPYTEWGWADQYGSPIAYPCYKEGAQTGSGKRMARFMQELGATVADAPGLGPDTETGKLC